MERKIIFLTCPEKVMEKEIIEIFPGIVFLGEEISTMGKEINYLACPGKAMEKDIIDIS